MKHGRSLAMALAVSMLAPLPALAQGSNQGPARGGMRGAMAGRLLIEQGSVEYLVTKATDLQLSADQTKQLEAIAARWVAETEAVRVQIRGMMPEPGQRRSGDGDREAMRERMQKMRPLAQTLSAEDRKALDEALLLLDDMQQAKAKALLEERVENARPRRGGRT